MYALKSSGAEKKKRHQQMYHRFLHQNAKVENGDNDKKDERAHIKKQYSVGGASCGDVKC